MGRTYPGGTHMLRHTGMCHPNGFFTKNSRQWSHFCQKKSLAEGPISPTLKKKLLKSAIFEEEKPLEMGPDLQKF